MFTASIVDGSSCRRAFLIAGALLFAVGEWAHAEAYSYSPIPVRIGSISASDPRLAQAVKETLLTDLAKSDRLTILGSTSPRGSAPARVTLTGSCLFIDRSVIINLRLVDSFGRTVPGAAENIDGSRSDVFRLVHTLAARFTSRISARGPSVARVQRPISSGPPKLTVVPKVKLPTKRTRDVPPADIDVPAEVLDDPIVRSDTQGKLLRKEPETETEDREDRDERSGRYTSVIIDARGLGLERSMSPKIRRRDGSTVYDGGNCTPDFAIETGVVAYATSMGKARDTSRCGSRPLVIEAIDRYDQPLPGDPLISDDDADYLEKAARRDGFLKKFNVIFLID